MGVASFKFRPLYLFGKKPWYPLNRMLDGSQRLCGHAGEQKIHASTENQNLVVHPGYSPILDWKVGEEVAD
jgi:hypothetical protein